MQKEAKGGILGEIAARQRAAEEIRKKSRATGAECAGWSNNDASVIL